ncbi:hypothetical protein [Moheibacter sediminis]|uniref:Lipoprotein n=1 Tax=Moheibacter sediminis TaxID=1434700 RepID=A0A1W2CTM4_9FLAO|nr:hypothetical protein [Moheibacter sediminis]SMC88571.1 hypothetical protein SAMN06296427_11155 [Moheibacter sediminis]
MKKIFRILPILLLAVFTVSCISSDDDFSNGGGNYHNEGRVSFDGITIPLTYADFYKRTNIQNGEVWALILSEEFIGYGNAHSDAYLYLEVFRPFGAPLDGIYDMILPPKTLDYAVYYEDVILYNGNITSYGFNVSDNSFVDGQVRIQLYSGDIYFFEVRLRTFSGQILNAYFEGRLQY